MADVSIILCQIPVHLYFITVMHLGLKINESHKNKLDLLNSVASGRTPPIVYCCIYWATQLPGIHAFCIQTVNKPVNTHNSKCTVKFTWHNCYALVVNPHTLNKNRKETLMSTKDSQHDKSQRIAHIISKSFIRERLVHVHKWQV